MLVLVDFAHNEAGLAGLLDVCRQLVDAPAGPRPRGARCGWRSVPRATGPTRSCAAWAAWPARGADDVVICEKRHYLRGRDLEGMNEILRGGVQEGGYAGKVEAFPSELAALQALEKRAKRGDVVAVMTHVERAEIFAWLQSAGYRPVPFDRLRELVGG